MFPKRLLRAERKKGFKSPEEVREREKEILSLFKDEKDEKTFTQVLEEAEKIGWHKLKSSVYRYILRLVNERKLIKEGKGRGAKYRCNFVELMELDHFRYLERLREFCSKRGLHSFHDMGAANCSMLGIPSSGLSEYESLIAEAIKDQLLNSWMLLFGLRSKISTRIYKKTEIIDSYSLLSLHNHALSELLVKIIESSPVRLYGKVKELFNTLKEVIINWTEENKIPCDFHQLYNIYLKYDLEKADPFVGYTPLEIDEESKLFPEEIVALTVTGDMMLSKEFSERVENWLKYYLLKFFKTAKRYYFNKAQELGEVTFDIYKTFTLRRENLFPRAGPFLLQNEEKERLLHWDVLLNRYGEKNTQVILDIVEEATKRSVGKSDDIDIQYWISEIIHKYLEENGLIESYIEESFWD